MVETGSGIKMMQLFRENMLSFFLHKYMLFIFRKQLCPKQKEKNNLTVSPDFGDC